MKMKRTGKRILKKQGKIRTAKKCKRKIYAIESQNTMGKSNEPI